MRAFKEHSKTVSWYSNYVCTGGLKLTARLFVFGSFVLEGWLWEEDFCVKVMHVHIRNVIKYCTTLYVIRSFGFYSMLVSKMKGSLYKIGMSVGFGAIHRSIIGIFAIERATRGSPIIESKCWFNKYVYLLVFMLV